MSVIERQLKLGVGDKSVDILIRIASPTNRGPSWECRWEIHWPSGPRKNVGRGVDAVQALLHAMQMVGIELYTSEEHKTGRLRWREQGKGYGFPVVRGSRDLLEGDDAAFF